MPDVPAWFVRLVNLQPGAGEAIVMRGWEQAAKVEVVSHPMFAVTRLWKSSLATLIWLLSCGTLGVLFGAILLRRQLRPLDYMVKQSLAITRREFLSQPDLPSTPEFRRVAQAMNLMVSKLKTLFEEEAERSERLRQEAYQDPQTGLANRRAFDIQFQDKLADDETSPGFLIMIRLQDLSGMNQRLGDIAPTRCWPPSDRSSAQPKSSMSPRKACPPVSAAANSPCSAPGWWTRKPSP